MKKIIIATLLATLTTPLFAQQQQGGNDTIRINARAGYSIGGTMPIGLPASIRHINSYTLMPSFQIGIDAEKMLRDNFGVMVGLRFENKGMQEDAQVKNYHMEMVRGVERLEGQFTGDVKTKVTQWMITIPLLATWHPADNVRLKFGPYCSYLLSSDFSGYAHNGYLRVNNPTGAKVNIGEKAGERGDYNFSDDMRKLQLGLQLGCDWFFTKDVGAYADLNWGITGVHKSSFKTIEQTLYPVYATLGVTYRLR